MNKIDFTSIFGQPVKGNNDVKTSLQMFFDKNIFEVSAGPSPDPYIGYKDMINNLEYMMKMGMDKDYFDADEFNQQLIGSALFYIYRYAENIPEYMQTDIAAELGTSALEEGSVGPLFARFMSGSAVLNRFEKMTSYDPELISREDSLLNGRSLNSTKKSGEDENPLISLLSRNNNTKRDPAFSSSIDDDVLYPTIAQEIRDFCTFTGISADNLVFNDKIYKSIGSVSIEFLDMGNPDSKIDPEKSYLDNFYTTMTLPSDYAQEFGVIGQLFLDDKQGYYHVNEDQGMLYATLNVPYYIFLQLLIEKWHDDHQMGQPTEEEYQQMYDQAKEITSHCYLKAMDMCWDDNKMFVQNLHHVYDERKAAYEASELYHALPTGFGDIVYPYMLPIVINASETEVGVCVPLNDLIKLLDDICQWLIDNDYIDPESSFTSHLKEQIAYQGINTETSFALTSINQFINLSPEKLDPSSAMYFIIIDTLNADTKINLNTTSYQNPDESILPKEKYITTYILLTAIETISIYVPDDDYYYDMRYLDNAELMEGHLTPAAISPILTDVELPELITNANDLDPGNVSPIDIGQTGGTGKDYISEP